MTRQERKAQAAKRKAEMELDWCERIGAKMGSGKTFNQAADEVRNVVVQSMRDNPQRKVEILGAWNRMVGKLAMELKQES
jgi:hypothetical protein